MSDVARLGQLIDRFGQTRVLCVGDLMLDRYVYGDVERISPEGPIPVLHIRREAAMLGGVGNVARNLAALGVTVDLVAAVGEDADAEEVTRLTEAWSGLNASLVPVSGRPTTTKTRYVAAGQQLLRADREHAESLPELARERILTAARDALSACSCLVLSDYGKGVVADGVTGPLIAAAQEADVPIVVDSKAVDMSRFAGVAVITPNKEELRLATLMPTRTDDEIIEASRRLIDLTSARWVLVTRGGDGMTLVERRGDARHLPAQAREVYDVSGAGDTVAAVMAAVVASGGGIVLGAQLANVAAGIVVGKVGTAAVGHDELRRALHVQTLLAAEDKLMSWDAARTQIESWQQAGLSVGFTNGCFDLLHPGHLSLFAQARSQCDRLVVGLNSDASVRRLKGDDRPVQSEAARAAVLASLSAVDLVCLFGEDTPYQIIEALRPDVLIKGQDYAPEDVVGKDLVEGWGGRLFLAELAEGESTSRMVERVKKS